ncbi:MAG: PspC domain-containing protein [Bacteroidales bacterium]|nr:PspC domain-containing protein [Bacteroidales bacterium]
MKKTINVSLGGRDYTIDEDAFVALSNYLDNYRAQIKNDYQPNEVMDELEAGIADHFDKALASGKKVIDLQTVTSTISTIGFPEGSHKDSFSYGDTYTAQTGPRKFFRDKKNGAIGGVCAGMAAYFNLDILLVRLIFIILLLGASVGFWLYIILWIIVPKAETPTQRCQMRGWATTPENLERVTKE